MFRDAMGNYFSERTVWALLCWLFLSLLSVFLDDGNEDFPNFSMASVIFFFLDLAPVCWSCPFSYWAQRVGKQAGFGRAAIYLPAPQNIGIKLS